jgi:hypothetical protein
MEQSLVFPNGYPSSQTNPLQGRLHGGGEFAPVVQPGNGAVPQLTQQSGQGGGEFGFNPQLAQTQPQENALQGFSAAAGSTSDPWAQFFGHPDVQNMLGMFGLSAPGQGGGEFGINQSGGAQPNWLGNMSQQQGSIGGPSAQNPVAGGNFMGGQW